MYDILLYLFLFTYIFMYLWDSATQIVDMIYDM